MLLPGSVQIVLTKDNAEAQQELFLLSGLGVAAYIVFAYAGYQLHSAARLPREARLAMQLAFWLLLVSWPFAALHWFGPWEWKMSHFALSFLGVLGCFRWIELLCGTGPAGFDRSALNFTVYFASPAEVLFEGDKFKRAPPGLFSSLIVETFAHMLLGTVVCSLGKPNSFMPFLGLEHDTLAMPMVGGPRMLPALYLQASWVYCMLAMNMCMQRLPLAFFGIDTANPMHAPLWLSTSVRDFWGRRWNLLIHRLMKRTFFEPLAKASTAKRQLGGCLAFLMSALFHEYMWFITNWPDRCGYVPGQPVLFFLCQFVLCAVEASVAKTAFGRWAAKLPKPLQVAYTIAVTLPLGGIFLRGIHGSFMVQCSHNDQTFELIRGADAALVKSAWPSPDKALAGVASLIVIASRIRRRLRRGAGAHLKDIDSEAVQVQRLESVVLGA